MCAKTGSVPVERAIELRLAGGVGQVVVAADDVGDRHVVVVDHHREHVGRRAVGAQQDHVVELRVGEAHLALDPILDDGLAVARRLQPDHRRARRAAPRPDRDRASGRRSTALRPSARACAAHRRELLRRAVAAIGRAARQQLPRHLGVALAAAATGTPAARRRSRPSQLRPSKIASIAASVERARSVSSIRSR